jgi:hypothetical protein
MRFVFENVFDLEHVSVCTGGGFEIFAFVSSAVKVQRLQAAISSYFGVCRNRDRAHSPNALIS